MNRCVLQHEIVLVSTFDQPTCTVEFDHVLTLKVSKLANCVQHYGMPLYQYSLFTTHRSMFSKHCRHLLNICNTEYYPVSKKY